VSPEPDVAPDVDLAHHGDREATPGLLDFAVNVHSALPPQWLVQVLTDALPGLGRYPDVAPAREALAALHGVPAASVLPVAGAAEAFRLVAGMAWQHPLVVHPQFTEQALRSCGHTVDRLVLEPGDGFALGGRAGTLEQDVDLVIVGNPTNPTSRLHPAHELTRLLAPGRTLVVNEAFMDAVEPAGKPDQSLAVAAATTPGLVVVRSLTKTFSIPGLRIGYVLAQPALIRSLAQRQAPWSVGSLACAAAVACAGEEGQRHAATVRSALPANRSHLAAGLARAGLSVVRSPRGPFLLARHAQAAGLRNMLRDSGFAVRRGDTFPGLGNQWLRLAVRTAPEQDLLLDALRAARPT